MAKKNERDIEKIYSTKQFAAKLRRLADALEKEVDLHTGLRKKSMFPHTPALAWSMKNPKARKKSNSSSSGICRSILLQVS